MRKVLLFFFILTALMLPHNDAKAKKPPITDTVPTTTTIGENNFNSNIETLVRYQEEQRAKQKKAAIIRIGSTLR